MSLSRLATLVWKELVELGRDRVLIIFVIYAFTGDIVIAAQGMRFDLSNAGMSVVDHDRSDLSRDLVGRFVRPYFVIRTPPRNERELLERIDSGQDILGLVIPRDFQADLLRGDRAAVQIFLDGSRPTHASLAEAYTREIVGSLSTRLIKERMGLAPEVDKPLPDVRAALRVRFNPNREEAFFVGLNEMLMMMSVLAIALPAAALIREREHGTIEQLLVSPLAPSEILLAKIAASTLVLMAGGAFSTFAILIPVYHVPVLGSLVLFFACAAVFIFTMSGLGLVVASLCRTMPQVAMVTIIVMAPVLFLSGAWTPPEAMPGWLADATILSPLRWFNEIAFGVFLRGASLRDLRLPIAAMTGLGALFFLWGALRFRTRLQ